MRRILCAAVLCAVSLPALAQTWQSGIVTSVQGPDPARNCEFFTIQGDTRNYAFPLPDPVSHDLLFAAWLTHRTLWFAGTGQSPCGQAGVASLKPG